MNYALEEMAEHMEDMARECQAIADGFRDGSMTLDKLDEYLSNQIRRSERIQQIKQHVRKQK